MNISKYFKDFGWFVQSFGYNEKETTIAPPTVVMYNDMYPYTVERTITVTHHSKPKRKNAARRWNNIKNYRF